MSCERNSPNAFPLILRRLPEGLFLTQCLGHRCGDHCTDRLERSVIDRHRTGGQRIASPLLDRIPLIVGGDVARLDGAVADQAHHQCGGHDPSGALATLVVCQLWVARNDPNASDSMSLMRMRYANADIWNWLWAPSCRI